MALPLTTTWAELINLCLRDSGAFGVGQEALAQDVTDLQTRLYWLLAQWKRKRWVVYHLVDLSVNCDGSQFYTIGPGGDIDTLRPDKIEAAYVRQITQPEGQRIDFPVRLIPSMEDYSLIAQKMLRGGPSYALFYDSGYPLGKLYPYPLNNQQFQLHVLIKDNLDQPGSLTDTILLPPEYHYALYTWGMKLARMAYRLPADPEINGQAKAALNTLRTANFQISTLNMPASVQSSGNGYNMFSDTFGPVYTR